jgi:hypothetical protein
MRIQKSKKAKRRSPAEGCALGAAHREERATERAYEALQHLRVIAEGADLTALYRKFFPEEFARETPDYGSVKALMLYYDRFARLVNERFFPVCGFLEFDAAYDEPEYALSHMHPVMINNWLWTNRVEYGYGPEGLHIVEKLVVSATDTDQVFHDVDFRRPAGHEFRRSLLNDACQEEKGRIRSLGLVADAILGDTGNVWLDLSEEEYAMSELPTWTEEQIKALAEEFAEAKRMHKEIREFFHWCDSPGKVERVKRLLRGCWVPENGERVRVLATPASRLIQSLGGFL